MFDVNDILAELAAGRGIEEIAQQAADALNAAKTAYDKAEKERKAKEEAEKKKAAMLQKAKEQKALDICNAIFDYGRLAFPDLVEEGDFSEFVNSMRASELVEAMDAGFTAMNQLGDFAKFMNKPTKEDEQAVVDAIGKFLAENGLI